MNDKKLEATETAAGCVAFVSFIVVICLLGGFLSMIRGC